MERLSFSRMLRFIDRPVIQTMRIVHNDRVHSGASPVRRVRYNTVTQPVEVRRARPSDWAVMIDITRDVWNGTDYFPFVWHQWLNDSDGYLAAAVMGDRVVGFQHVYRQPDGAAWLEGIRVAPDVRGQGIARHLVDDGILWARWNDCPSVRLSTSSGNIATNRLADRVGFRRTATFRPLTAKLTEGEGQIDGARVATPADFAAVRDFLTHSRASEGTSEFYTQGWTTYRLTDDRLNLLLATHAVAVAGQSTIRAMSICTCTNPFDSLDLGLILGQVEDVEDMSRWLLRRGGAKGIEQVRAKVEAPESLIPGLERAGFEPAYDFSMLLYELPLTESIS